MPLQHKLTLVTPKCSPTTQTNPESKSQYCFRAQCKKSTAHPKRNLQILGLPWGKPGTSKGWTSTFLAFLKGSWKLLQTPSVPSCAHKNGFFFFPSSSLLTQATPFQRFHSGHQAFCWTLVWATRPAWNVFLKFTSVCPALSYRSLRTEQVLALRESKVNTCLEKTRRIQDSVQPTGGS